MTRLFADLVRDSLTEDTYDAALAGLSYGVHSNMLGIHVSTSGYNDKQHVFLELILQRIRDLEIKEERLVVMKDKVW